MDSDLLKIVSTQGVWAVLSFVLIYYITKTQANRDQKQESREDNYQKIILDLTDKLSIVTEIYDFITNQKK